MLKIKLIFKVHLMLPVLSRLCKILVLTWMVEKHCMVFFFHCLLFNVKHSHLSSGVFRVSEREGKNVDLQAKSTPPGVQFLEWTFSETRTQHLWNAHLSPQGKLHDLHVFKCHMLDFIWVLRDIFESELTKAIFDIEDHSLLQRAAKQNTIRLLETECASAVIQIKSHLHRCSC